MRQHNQPNKNRARNAGQSIVETALILPVIILLMVGILDLGRVYYAYITIFNAAREGARYGSAHPSQGATIVSRAKGEVNGSLVDANQMVVTYECDTQCIPGNAIKVHVLYNGFQLITSTIVGGGMIPMRASAQMEIYSP